MKVLNLYAGIGGNRKLWYNCEVTAVENDSDVADIYYKLYPNDTVIIDDARTYLEKYINEYDFIWASPLCQSHGQYRHNVGVLGKKYPPLLPDMTSLYGTIIFLKTYYSGFWCVENTIPYYKPLIDPSVKLQQHLFWSNFPIFEKSFPVKNIRSNNKISDFDGYETVSESNIKNKRQVLRNCVDSKVGLYIYEHMIELYIKDKNDE